MSASVDVFITADQNLLHQQNLHMAQVGIIVLIASTNRLPDLLPLVSETLRIISSIRPGELVEVS